ncbi:WXG100 family type VII secretion target [Nocardioides sp.]|uniref:WXG100 family type VII secretion target n=1 Tax=Nocardioides sp. TaxID=35761 RepID=UPI00271A1CEF|nr:WXG100 family type VII secretion target [Nocardioides sp.]MDO9457662.1 WXG100 family type VII secretion target [Nocardioides sp.]
MDHYQLDVDPAGLRQVARSYAAMAEELDARADKVSATPDEIGDAWQGGTATTVKADMRAVGSLLGTYRGHLERASTAVSTLATAYADGLETIGRLNSQRADAEADCRSDLAALDRAQEKEERDLATAPPNRYLREELADGYATRRSGATAELDRVLGTLDTRFAEVVEECRLATTTCAGALAHAVHVKVPQSITLNLSDPAGAQDAYAAMYDAAEETLGNQLTLVKDLDELDDQEKVDDRDRVEKILYNYSNNTDERDELLELLKKHQGDPEFAGMLAGKVDVQLLGNAIAQAQDGPWADGTALDDSYAYTDELMKAIGPLLGLGSLVQGDYQLPDGKVDEWYGAITAAQTYGRPDVWPGSQTVVAALMAQGSWDPTLLADVMERVLVFERDELGGSDEWEFHTGRATADTADGYFLDPVQALATALGRNRSAAQQLLDTASKRTLELDGDDVEVSHTLAYLLLEREWNGPTGEKAVGDLLKAALEEKPGDLTPAELARQLQGVITYGEEQTKKAEEEAERNDKPWYVDLGHLVLDVGGLVPFIGEPADLVNAGWYEAEGDHLNASLSAAGALPFAGWAATGGKFSLKGLKGLADVSPDLVAKLTKQFDSLGDQVSFDVYKLNGKDFTHVDFKSADDLAAALKTPQPNTMYQSGDLYFTTDAKGVLTVGGKGGMRRFMALGEHLKHLPTGTEIRYSGHAFRKNVDGTLELIAVSRFKPIWGHGEAFNIQNWSRYTHNEIYLANGKRLDSYDPGKWIVERKYRQYADLKDAQQLRKDIDLLATQYKPGELVPRTPGNVKHFGDAAGKPLSGKPLLEIPPQLGPLDPNILKYASRRRPPITIRDTDGKIYSYQFPTGRLPG